MAMSGVSVKIEVNMQPAIDALRRLASLDRTAIPAAHDDAGRQLQVIHQDRFDRETGPDGTPWVPLNPFYAKTKKGKKILRESSALFTSLNWQVEGSTLLFGVDRVYAATHQFGRGGIPARPFIGVSAEDADELAEIYLDHLRTLYIGGAASG